MTADSRTIHRRPGINNGPRERCDRWLENRCAAEKRPLDAVEEKSIALAKAMLGIFELEQKYAALEDRLARQAVTVPIQSLEPYSVEVVIPILAVLRDDEGTFVASWFDANVNASGDSEPEAIEMLKESVVGTFLVLREQESVLSDDLRAKLRLMQKFLRAK